MYSGRFPVTASIRSAVSRISSTLFSIGWRAQVRMRHAVTPDEMTVFSHLAAHQFFVRNVAPRPEKKGFHAPLAQAVSNFFVYTLRRRRRSAPTPRRKEILGRKLCLVRLLHFCQIFPLHPHCQPAHASQKHRSSSTAAQAEQFFPHGTLILNDPIYHFRCVSPEL